MTRYLEEANFAKHVPKFRKRFTVLSDDFQLHPRWSWWWCAM